MLKRNAGSTRFVAAAAVAAFLSLGLVGCKPAEEKEPTGTEVPSPTPPAPGGPQVRQEINKLTPDQIAAFRKGVALMQSRAETDPTGWLYQANIHGFPTTDPSDQSNQVCSPPTAPTQTAWGTCNHGNFFFLSWHRIYLYYFERILRAAVQEATADPNYVFALPYWDYENPANQALPEPFRLPAEAANPLYVAERAANCNDGSECVSPEVGSSTEAMTRIPFCNCGPGDPGCPGCQDGISSAMAFGSQYASAPLQFNGFGELESQPHNVVHDAVGGPDGWMGWVQCAARDGIFWLHHANIDRLWQVWLNQGGRDNPLGADNWKNEKFTFFDETGKEVTMTGCDVVNMATQLDYQYQLGDGSLLPVENVQLCTPGATNAQAETSPAPAAAKPKILTQAVKATTLGDAPVSVKVPAAKPTTDRLLALSAPDAAPDATHVWLVIEGLKRLHPGGYYEVYLNLPAGQQPDPKGPHYVGNIALFGSDHGSHKSEVERAFDITDEVRELRQANLWKDEINLTFVRGNPEARSAKAVAAFISFRSVKVVEK
jgi:hypothetical protein